ncbi:hypothetical protein VFPPC_17395 [Pochonia chlamydosporia 170]|uniref:Uncharacterized protein n=1 Tax=Pochonia chlamydosporia 170 TaxID=1380566 RepID=A0A219ARN7_METCM|nr:hypothetical protein VFPPC_17395 [Pochonia chlamydosporia 170]OWT43456.1 hypothetical protein VFPPC_17395 [Pochonia chlamydosporia 170]
MPLSPEVIVALVALFIALPPAVAVVWQCRRARQHRHKEEEGFHPPLQHHELLQLPQLDRRPTTSPQQGHVREALYIVAYQAREYNSDIVDPFFSFFLGLSNFFVWNKRRVFEKGLQRASHDILSKEELYLHVFIPSLRHPRASHWLVRNTLRRLVNRD